MIKGKKLVLKPGQIIKNQQSPPSSNYFMNPQNLNQSQGLGQVGVNIGSKERVMIDQRTYNELMSFIIKNECKRIERDKIQSLQQSNVGMGGSLNSKRPNSTLKRLGPIPQQERHSNNPNPARVIYQNQPTNAGFFYPQNSANFNNSSFLSQVNEGGRASKQSKTPSKKQQLISTQQQKFKQIYAQPQVQILSNKNNPSHLQSIKRNNYVNELSQAYTHGTGTQQNVQLSNQNISQQQFFNINNNIPTSKKGTQKKLVIQDTLATGYSNTETRAQIQLQHELMMSGKLQGTNALTINPQYYYNITDKVQSARGAQSTERDVIGGGNGAQKISNFLMAKTANPTASIETNKPQSHRDNQSRSSKAGNNTHMQSQQQHKHEDGLRRCKAKEIGEEGNSKSAKIGTKRSSQSRLNLQIDSDLLYGSQDMNNVYNLMPQIMHEDPMIIQVPISNKATTDTHGFDTFGDSDNTTKKITAISELQSPDRTNSPSHVAAQLQQKMKVLKAYEDSDDISNHPYGNKVTSNHNENINQYTHNGLQEFHYSGSFGVPGTFQNQSAQHEALAHSMIQAQAPANNLSFSICNNNNISIVAQPDKVSKEMILIQQQNFFNRPLIILDKGGSSSHQSIQSSQRRQHIDVANDFDDYDEEEDDGQQVIGQPFYTYDDQNEEQYFIIDHDAYDQPNSGEANFDIANAQYEHETTSNDFLFLMFAYVSISSLRQLKLLRIVYLTIHSIETNYQRGYSLSSKSLTRSSQIASCRVASKQMKPLMGAHFLRVLESNLRVRNTPLTPKIKYSYQMMALKLAMRRPLTPSWRRQIGT